MQHLNVAVKRIIKPEQYDGDEDFNPFKMISDYKEADELLSSWISVVMDGLASSSFNKQLTLAQEKLKIYHSDLFSIFIANYNID